MSDWSRRRVSKLPRDSNGRPYAFKDLPADQFPFRIDVHDENSGEQVWTITVFGPGAVRVPGFGRRVRVTTTVLSTGEHSTVDSDGNVVDDHGNILEPPDD